MQHKNAVPLGDIIKEFLKENNWDGKIKETTQLAYARHLGLTLPAAKSRVQRARQHLQQQLVTACQVTFDHAGRVCCFVPRAPLESSEK